MHNHSVSSNALSKGNEKKMHLLYIDYFSHISLTDRVKQTFSGAGNGTKLLVLQIMESEYYGKYDVYLILHKNYKPADEIEEKIIGGEGFKKIYVESLDEIEYSHDAILFIPLVCGREMIVAEKLKKKYPYLKIYGRIHDRNHNFPFDFHDRFYYTGWKRTGLYSFIDFYGKKVLFALKYASWIKCFDKVLTVSNYSLQQLAHTNVRFINYYYQGILECYTSESETRDKQSEEYILFVNGGRPEKNGLRAIEAFIEYKNSHRNDPIKLYVTSTKKETQNALLKKLVKDKRFNQEEVLFFDYLEYDQLKSLYANSSFLLFSSKGEGFGLPLLESLYCGRPVLASWGTSIPEVAGSSVRYVNPFDNHSIAKGIEYLRVPDHLKFYEEAIRRRKKIIDKQIEEDARMFIRELFED